MRDVVRLPDEILRKQAKNVNKVDEGIKALIDEMLAMLKTANGVGLAANQVGVLYRLFVYDDGNGNSGALINPKIISSKGEQLGPEGCLSIPGLQGDVRRSYEVVVQALDMKGKPVKIKAEGFLARIFQHEIDHLFGTLFIDRAEPDSLEYVTADDDED